MFNSIELLSFMEEINIFTSTKKISPEERREVKTLLVQYTNGDESALEKIKNFNFSNDEVRERLNGGKNNG